MDSNDGASSSSDELNFTINADYASKYDKWRSMEEYQKLRAKYGDVDIDKTGRSDSESSSSSEDEDAAAFTPAMEKDFLRTLSALKSHDPKIYDPKIQFFCEAGDEDDNVNAKKSSGKEKTKPMYLKDYEREVILQRDGKFSDEESDENDDNIDNKDVKPATYYEEQDEIRQSFKNALNDDADDDDGDDNDNLLNLRVKTEQEKLKEEDEYLEWLKGQRQISSNDPTVGDLKPLQQFWTDPKLDDGEKFLRNYLLNKEYLEEDDEIPSYEEIVRQLEDDEQQLDKEDQFEKKFNFRYEEPDADVIKSYPRVIPETLRNKDSRRITARLAVRERKRLEKEKRQEELKRLKNLKKQEILDKMERLNEIAGSTDVGFTEHDVEGDFDEAEYDNMMKAVFNDEYYSREVDMEKPVFPDADDEVENWDDWQPTSLSADTYNDQQCNDINDVHNDLYSEDPGFIMDADYDPSQKRVKVKKKDRKKERKQGVKLQSLVQEEISSKKRRRSKFAEALERPKPLFNAEDRTFEQYFDEYYSLDYEDIVADLPVRFKYRKVMANDFGLSVNEVLSVPDKELNAWVSVKKMSQYRADDEEHGDVRRYYRKARNPQTKLNVLTSLRQPEVESASEVTKSTQKAGKVTDNDRTTLISDDVRKHETQPTKEFKGKKRKHKKQAEDSSRKKHVGEEKTTVTSSHPGVESTTVPAASTADGQSSATKKKNKKKKKKQKKKDDAAAAAGANRDRRLPEMSDERLKAYGINPKKFKYYHKKKLLAERS